MRLSESEAGVAVPAIANPGTLISTGAGGGRQLGHDLAHESEAPYPVAVPAFFIRSHCHPDGLVLDPFGGSATTYQAAHENGRRCVVADIRRSQCELSRRRIEDITHPRYGIRDNPALAAGPRPAPLPGQMSFLPSEDAS